MDITWNKEGELSKGFTLIEILIVIAIIGIFAAIVIPTYEGMKNSPNVPTINADTISTKICDKRYLTKEEEIYVIKHDSRVYRKIQKKCGDIKDKFDGGL